jgi:phospholipase/carboxylesterase
MPRASRTRTLSLPHRIREPVSPGAGSERPPLLILFHGIGANELSMASIAGKFDPRLLVVCPRSPIELAPYSYAWFHTTFTPHGPIADAAEAEAAWKRIPEFVDEVVDVYGTDPTRAFIGGFSQGAIVSLAALLTAPDRIAGVVAMSGRLLSEALPHAVAAERLRGKPVIIIHGTEDEKLGIEYGRAARDRLKEFPLDITYHEFRMRHTATPESLAAAAAWLSARLSSEERTFQADLNVG